MNIQTCVLLCFKCLQRTEEFLLGGYFGEMKVSQTKVMCFTALPPPEEIGNNFFNLGGPPPPGMGPPGPMGPPPRGMPPVVMMRGPPRPPRIGMLSTCDYYSNNRETIILVSFQIKICPK